MKYYLMLGLLALVAALVLASCANPGGGSQGSADGQQKETGGMAGLDHSSMGHASGGMASRMLMENSKYSDERFSDAMVPHHQGAIEMARVALENAEHEEIVQLSENIISTQQAEIEELKSIKHEEFGTSRVPIEMSQEQMQDMGVMIDPQELANREPSDKAFSDAMIPHLQSAIEMAKVAYRESEIPEIKDLADNVMSAQQTDIEQMKQWREQWYPGG
jgi:uncharacterized protein (DUF305 family)